MEQPICLSLAVDRLRELALEVCASDEAPLSIWETIVTQFTDRNGCCDGHLVDELQNIIEIYVDALEETSVLSLWLETETGNGNDPDECIADALRPSLVMELLFELTNLASFEARPKKTRRRGPR